MHSAQNSQLSPRELRYNSLHMLEHVQQHEAAYASVPDVVFSTHAAVACMLESHLHLQLQQQLVLALIVGAVQAPLQLAQQLPQVLLQLLAGPKSCKRCHQAPQCIAQV